MNKELESFKPVNIEKTPTTEGEPVDFESPKTTESLINTAKNAVDALKQSGQEKAAEIATRAETAVDAQAIADLTKIDSNADRALTTLEKDYKRIEQLLVKLHKESPTTENEEWENPYQEIPAKTEHGRRYMIKMVDANGNIIGTIERETSKDRVAEGTQFEGWQVHDLILHGEKDGQLTSIDVLQLANRHNAKVIMGGQGNFLNLPGVVLAPLVESPLDIAVMLHELGHEDQRHNPQMAPIISNKENPRLTEGARQDPTIRKNLSPEEIAIIDTHEQYYQELMNTITARVKFEEMHSEEISQINAAIESKLNGRDEMEIITNQLEAITTRFPVINDYIKQLDEIDSKLRPLESQIAALSKNNPDIIKASSNASGRLLERDATRQSFRWIKKILDTTGVDLKKTISIPRHDYTRSSLSRHYMEQHCATTGSNQTNIVIEAAAALASYGARKMPVPKGFKREKK